MMACRKSVPQAFDVTNQQIAAAVGERKRAEKRLTFDLEPPIAGGIFKWRKISTAIPMPGREARIFDDVRTEVTEKLTPDERVPMNRYLDGSPIYPGALCPGLQSLIRAGAERHSRRRLEASSGVSLRCIFEDNPQTYLAFVAEG